MSLDVLKLLTDDVVAVEAARASNRKRFTAAAELADLFRAADIPARVIYAENFITGETIGKREAVQ